MTGLRVVSRSRVVDLLWSGGVYCRTRYKQELTRLLTLRPSGRQGLKKKGDRKGSLRRPFSIWADHSRQEISSGGAPDTRIRINDGIYGTAVRLIDEKGQQAGVKTIQEALDYAAESNLDLVEVAPQADPPVCRVMNFSKYRYEQELKAKQARKHQSTIVIKEIKLRPKIGVPDYETKKSHVVRFLEHKDKVKVTIMFRGRELVHPERGERCSCASPKTSRSWAA